MEISAGRDVEVGGDVVGGDKVVAGRDVQAVDGSKGEKTKRKSWARWLVKLAAATGLQGPLMVLVDWLKELV
jgi:hypothetical protein